MARKQPAAPRPDIGNPEPDAGGAGSRLGPIGADGFARQGGVLWQRSLYII